MAKQRQRLVEVPFNKTDCGVDFYINTAYGGECPWVLTEHEVFKTDFFGIAVHGSKNRRRGGLQ